MSNVPPYDPYGQPQQPGGGYNPPPPPGGGYNPPPPPGGGYNPPPPPPGGYTPPPPPGGYNPPPAPGGYTPPPPPGGGYAPMPPPPPGGYDAPGGYNTPVGYQSYGGAAGMPGNLAEWWPRVLGYLIDMVPVIVLVLIATVLHVAIVAILVYLVIIAYSIFLPIQVGQVGSSPGMRVVGLKCVSESTGQPIGGGMGFVRSLAHIVDSIICDIGFLFPLWDSKKQTLADKIIGTVVITVPKQGWSITPAA